MQLEKGKIVFDLRPSEGNARNSEGAFLDLNDGRILFVYSHFIGNSFADSASACIAARYSIDQGDTWSDDEVLFSNEDQDAVNLMSVSLLRMQNGDIGCFYLIRYGWQDTRLHLRRSSDEGRTWGMPLCCIPTIGYYVTNNDRVVRLSSGRLIIPAALMRIIPDRKSNGNTHFFLSDDDGYSWREAKNFCVIPVPRSQSGLLEPGVVELNNGVVWAWSRTDMGYQYEMYSTDGGESWSIPAPSPFTSPNSPLSMKRIPVQDCLLAVWNPIPNYLTRDTALTHTRGRTPLLGAISYDEGKTWGSFFAVESGKDHGGYSYTAIHIVGDAVLLAYCAGVPDDRHNLARLKIRKIGLTEMI